MTRPLILTAGFDAAGFARFQADRRTHFPPERNVIDAHLTLFHALPGDRIDEIGERLDTLTAQTPPLPYTVCGIMDFGGGCGWRIDAPGLHALHAGLQRAWADMLTRQDAQGFRPHVTVQNKVDRQTALATQAQLRENFEPWQGMIPHLALWHYDGGPWEAAAQYDLRGDT